MSDWLRAAVVLLAGACIVLFAGTPDLHDVIIQRLAAGE